MWEDQVPETIARLRQSVYVDDLVTSVCDHSELIELQTHCSEIFKSVSMNMRGWTNTPDKVLGLSFVLQKTPSALI